MPCGKIEFNGPSGLNNAEAITDGYAVVFGECSLELRKEDR